MELNVVPSKSVGLEKFLNWIQRKLSPKNEHFLDPLIIPVICKVKTGGLRRVQKGKGTK